MPREDLELTCSEDRLVWETKGFGGGLFLFLHTFVMISAALQVERAFYSALHKSQYFSGELPINETVVEAIREMVFEGRRGTGEVERGGNQVGDE